MPCTRGHRTRSNPRGYREPRRPQVLELTIKCLEYCRDAQVHLRVEWVPAHRDPTTGVSAYLNNKADALARAKRVAAME